MHNPEQPNISLPSRKSRFKSRVAAQDPLDPAPDGEPLVLRREENIPVAPRSLHQPPEYVSTASIALPEALPTAAPGLAPSDAAEVAPPVHPAGQPGPSAAFRLQYAPPEQDLRRKWHEGWLQAGIGLALLAAGYAIGSRRGAPAANQMTPSAARALTAQYSAVAPTVEEQKSLDAVFGAIKNSRFAEARTQLAALAQRNPAWTSLNVEAARAAFYAHDIPGVQKLVEDSARDFSIPAADGKFLLALLRMGAKDYEIADRYFGESAGADPTRAETYFFWGDCLMRWGKTADAVEKFRAAVLRNQYETSENLYQTKLWLAQIQAGQDTAEGIGPRLDAALAAAQPTGGALIAGAARAVKAVKFADAAALLARARLVTDPAVFRVLVSDPFISQEAWRPELSPIYEDLRKPVKTPTVSSALPHEEPANQPPQGQP